MTPEELKRWVEGGFSIMRAVVADRGMDMAPVFFFYALRDPETGEPIEPTTLSCTNDGADRATTIRVLAKLIEKSDTQATITIWIDREMGNVNCLANTLEMKDPLTYVADVSEVDGVTICGPFRPATMHVLMGAPGAA